MIKGAEIYKLRAFIGNRIVKCWLAQTERRRRYEREMNCVEESMVSLYPLQKERREAAARGSKEGRTEKDERWHGDKH